MNDILNLIPQKYHIWVLISLWAAPYLTRAYKALANGGGIKGVWDGIWFGTNTPKAITQLNNEIKAEDAAAAKPPEPPKVTLNIPLLLVLGALALSLTACASLEPSANSLTVRAEQAESGTLATFNFVVNADDANRGFWQTNAPAFHNFAEFLREPLTNNGTMYRRGLYMIKQVDDAKLVYKANLNASNVLVQAILDLAAAKSQADAWYVIVTTTPQPK